MSLKFSSAAGVIGALRVNIHWLIFTTLKSGKFLKTDIYLMPFKVWFNSNRGCI